MTEEQAWSYLAGMIDGEGCVYTNPNQRCLTISTTEEDLLRGLYEVLDFLGIAHSTSVQQKGRVEKGHAICYDVRIMRFEGFVLIYENCPLRSTRKRGKLRTMLLSYKRKVYTEVQAP